MRESDESHPYKAKKEAPKGKLMPHAKKEGHLPSNFVNFDKQKTVNMNPNSKANGRDKQKKIEDDLKELVNDSKDTRAAIRGMN